MRNSLWITLILLLPVAGAVGQSVQTPTIESTLTTLRSTYRSGPVAQRGEITYHYESGARRAFDVFVVLDASGGQPSPGVRWRVELSSVHVEADGSIVRVIHERDPKTYYEVDVGKPAIPESLQGLIPDLPVPQLQLAFGGDKKLPRVLPGIGDLRWTELTSSDTEFVLRGESRTGTVTITTTSATGALRSIEVVNQRPTSMNSLARIEAVYEPIVDVESDAWSLDLQGRRRVESLADLRKRPAITKVGQRAPDLSLLNAELESSPLREVLGALRYEYGEHSPSLAIAMLHDSLSADEIEPALAVIDRTLASARLADQNAADLRLLIVAVADLDAFDAAALGEFARQWKGLDDYTDRFGPTWLGGRAASLDRFFDEADAGLIVIDPQRTLTAAVQLIPRVEGESLDEALSRAVP